MDERLRKLQRDAAQDSTLEAILAANLCRAAGHDATDSIVDRFYIRICSRCATTLEVTALETFTPQQLRGLEDSFKPEWKKNPSQILSSELFRRQEHCSHSLHLVLTSHPSINGSHHSVKRVCRHCTQCLTSAHFSCPTRTGCQCSVEQWSYNEETRHFDKVS